MAQTLSKLQKRLTDVLRDVTDYTKAVEAFSASSLRRYGWTNTQREIAALRQLIETATQAEKALRGCHNFAAQNANKIADGTVEYKSLLQKLELAAKWWRNVLEEGKHVGDAAAATSRQLSAAGDRAAHTAHHEFLRELRGVTDRAERIKLEMHTLFDPLR